MSKTIATLDNYTGTVADTDLVILHDTSAAKDFKLTGANLRAYTDTSLVTHADSGNTAAHTTSNITGLDTILSGIDTELDGKMPLIIPNEVTWSAAGSSATPLTKFKLNNLSYATASTYYFPVLAEGEWVEVRLLVGAGAHTLDCGTVAGLYFGKVNSNTDTTTTYAATNEFNVVIRWRRVGGLLVKGV